MPYNLNKTNGELFLTIADGTLNTSTSMYFIGRNYPSYGEFQQENFLRLLESNANSTPPATPIKGQLWYDTSVGALKIYDGTRFKAQANLIISGSLNTNYLAQGDLWWDTTNQQLKAWNGSFYNIIGPLYNSFLGNSGPVVETFYNADPNPANRTPKQVVVNYVNGVRTTIESISNDFVPNVAVPGWSTIPMGLSSNLNATNPLVITSLGNQGNAIIRNFGLNANISLQVNRGGAVINSLQVNGTDGRVRVAFDPTHNLGIATKQYVDFFSAISNSKIFSSDINTQANINLINSNIATANVRLTLIEANLTAANLDIDILAGNLIDLSSNIIQINSNVTAANIEIEKLRANLGSYQIYANANAAAQSIAIANLESNISSNVTASINTLSNLLALKANIDSPTFTGNINSVTYSLTTSNTTIATTEFVQGVVQSAYQPFAGIDIFNPLSTYTDQFWTVPSNVNKAKFTLTAGGGAGSNSFNNNLQGVGGGAGGSAVSWLTVHPGETYRIRVGRGGSPNTGITAGGAGGNGENTVIEKILPTVGVTITALGGAGGSIQGSTPTPTPGSGGGGGTTGNNISYSPITISQIGVKNNDGTTTSLSGYPVTRLLQNEMKYLWLSKSDVKNQVVPCSIIMIVPNVQRVTAYRLYYYYFGGTRYMPRYWTFEGGDGTNWTILDTQNAAADYSIPDNRPNMPIDEAPFFEGRFNNPNSYSHYRVKFTELGGAAIPPDDFLGLSAVRLFVTSAVTELSGFGGGSINGNLNVTGGSGGANSGIPGVGGNSMWGAGASIGEQNSDGRPGGNYGGGGSGGWQGDTYATVRKGGRGGPGVVMIEY